jgi:predicted secreted protein
MKHDVTVLLFAVLLAAFVFVSVGSVTGAEAPEEEWNSTFGGSSYDYGSSVQQTIDGGYIITGYTHSYGAGSDDVWLIKTAANGTKDWSRTFGDSANDQGSSVQQTTDGGYIITGYTHSYGAGAADVWLIKTAANGTKDWSRTFGGPVEDRGHSVQQTTDGGYIIVGSTASFGAGGCDVWLLKTTANGTVDWNSTFGGPSQDYGYAVQQTADYGYIVAGSTNSFGAGSGDVWLLKVAANGTAEWNNTFGGLSDDVGHSVQQTADGGYVIAGSTNSFGAGSGDVWLLKVAANGTEDWNNTFGGFSDDIGYSVQQTADGGHIIAGSTHSFGAGSGDVWLLKTAANGSERWNSTFGGFSDDGGHSVQQTTDGGYVIAGSTHSVGGGSGEVWLIKVKGVPAVLPIFDTGKGAYPSISGIHNGTITPSYNLTLSKLYTYPCAGTGGHTEYVKIWNSTDWNVTATWNGYTDDWHNLSFNNSFTLYANETYNYTIQTGSYPQIIHEPSWNATGGVITCSEFVDANGKRYGGWIPAIKLWSD